MNLRDTIENLPRCIVICLRGRWACTDIEGAEYSELEFHGTLLQAIQEFSGKTPRFDDWERKTTMARESYCMKNGMVWTAEWLAGTGWIRPFGKVGGQLKKAV